VLKFEFTVETIIIFVKSVKKDIERYVHFIGNSMTYTVINLPKRESVKRIINASYYAEHF